MKKEAEDAIARLVRDAVSGGATQRDEDKTAYARGVKLEAPAFAVQEVREALEPLEA